MKIWKITKLKNEPRSQASQILKFKGKLKIGMMVVGTINTHRKLYNQQ
jgi:hypothetical protein